MPLPVVWVTAKAYHSGLSIIASTRQNFRAVVVIFEIPKMAHVQHAVPLSVHVSAQTQCDTLDSLQPWRHYALFSAHKFEIFSKAPNERTHPLLFANVII